MNGTKNMRRLHFKMLICAFALALAGTAVAGDQIDIRLKDGSRWRGKISAYVHIKFVEHGVETELRAQIVDAADLILTVEAKIAGEVRRKTIFRDDILEIRTLREEERDKAAATNRAGVRRKDASDNAGTDLGVFILPLEGMVGTYFRHDEIKSIGEHADQYGEGQTIVLLIDSHGGLVTEMEENHEAVMELKKRHRVVAWIKTAISAAAGTVLACDEIYFMTEGTLGAMTAYAGTTALKGKQLEYWMNAAGEWMEDGGHSKYLAHAMIHAPSKVSYNKDPETGKVTWYDDLSGEVVLSDGKSNLVFTSTTATKCGFADGVADTEEELATVLNLPKWHEIDNHGRRMAKDWQETVKRAEHEIPLLWNRLSYAGTGSGDLVEILGKRIQIYEKLIRWHDRCPNVALMTGLLPKDRLEREVKELRKQLADIKKARRNG